LATPSTMAASRRPATTDSDAVIKTPVTHALTLLALGPLAWSKTLFANLLSLTH
jgi:hypothetical protein